MYERTGSVMRCPRHRQKEIVFENVKPKSCEKHHADNQLGYSRLRHADAETLLYRRSCS